MIPKMIKNILKMFKNKYMTNKLQKKRINYQIKDKQTNLKKFNNLLKL